MSYKCPRCKRPVKRGSSTGAALAGGAAGAMIAAAFSPLQCPNCGPIKKHEFPPDVQKKLTAGTLAYVGGATVLVVVCIVLLVAIKQTDK
jgi:DNA-directed RNA polymerase subunit RPC12/RpoP